MEVIESNGVRILECSAGSIRIASERDALDLLGLCGEYETDRVLISWECIDAAFFDLKTGLAGAVLLKLSMYRVKAAVILPEEKIGTGKFHEFVLETNRGSQFRVYSDREVAVEWLSRL